MARFGYAIIYQQFMSEQTPHRSDACGRVHFYPVEKGPIPTSSSTCGVTRLGTAFAPRMGKYREIHCSGLTARAISHDRLE